MPTNQDHEDEGSAPGSRAIAYHRSATPNRQSLEWQAIATGDLLAAMRWDLAGQYCDNGSGRGVVLPGLQEAIAALDAGNAGMLVVADVSRLGREWSAISRIIESAEKSGWSIVSCTARTSRLPPRPSSADWFVSAAGARPVAPGQRRRNA